MGQPTKELLIEILSEEPSQSGSSLSSDFCTRPKKQDHLDNHSADVPSPFKGEGQGEGKDRGNMSSVVIGQLKDITNQSQPLVDFPGNPDLDPVPARSTVQLGKSHLGQNVVLVFDQGDRRKPIVMGILYSSDNKPPESSKDEKAEQMEPTTVEVDGERLLFTAKKEIVLKCGKASITLTKAGKILIRGAYLLSRSSGVNRVKGGSVQLN